MRYPLSTRVVAQYRVSASEKSLGAVVSDAAPFSVQFAAFRCLCVRLIVFAPGRVLVAIVDSRSQGPASHVRILGVLWLIYGIVRLLDALWLVSFSSKATIMFQNSALACRRPFFPDECVFT